MYRLKRKNSYKTTKCKKRIGEIGKQFCVEIYTVRKPQDAEELFSWLTKMVQDGTGIELIIRKV